MSMHSRYIGTRATSSCVLPIFLAVEIRQIPIFCPWLDAQSLSNLDMAVSSHSARKQWLIILKSITCKAINEWRHSYSSMMWVIKRKVRVTRILVNATHRDSVSDLTFEAVSIQCDPTSCDCVKVKGDYDSILLTWEERKYLQSIDVSKCWDITDIGLSALGLGCGQLQTINLSDCRSITDIGLSALGHGCGQLRMINLTNCRSITDIGLTALGQGCGQLQTINLSGCRSITDIDRCL
jgi:hypothetical protein